MTKQELALAIFFLKSYETQRNEKKTYYWFISSFFIIFFSGFPFLLSKTACAKTF